jgi:hypothetical protein
MLSVPDIVVVAVAAAAAAVAAAANAPAAAATAAVRARQHGRRPARSRSHCTIHSFVISQIQMMIERK